MAQTQLVHLSLNKLKNNNRQNITMNGSFPFSPNAISEFQKESENFQELLFSEAINICKNRDLDSVSPSHIVEAKNRLINKNGNMRRYRMISKMGWLFLGASLTTFITMIITQQYIIIGSLITFFFGIPGAFMINTDRS